MLRVDQDPGAHRIFLVVDIHGFLQLGLVLRIENFAQRGQSDALRGRGQRVLLFQCTSRYHGMIFGEWCRVGQKRPSVRIVDIECLSNANAGRLHGLQLLLFDEQRAGQHARRGRFEVGMVMLVVIDFSLIELRRSRRGHVQFRAAEGRVGRAARLDL